MATVKHYFADGTQYKGDTHTMPNGDLYSGDRHGVNSERLFDLKDLPKTAQKKAKS